MKKLMYLPFIMAISSCTHADATKELSEKIYCELVERTINLPDLQQYFHIDAFPKRNPLTLSVDPYVSECSKLVKFSKPISILSATETKKHMAAGYLEFAIISITSTNAEIEFKYAPEGIMGKLKLKLVDSHWIVSESKIVES